MKLLVMNILAVFFPWLALFIEDNPGSAIIALIMQATLIGWIPASIWAWRVVQENNFNKRLEQERKKAKKEEAKKERKAQEEKERKEQAQKEQEEQEPKDNTVKKQE